MTHEEHQELAFILGQIVGILNELPGRNEDKLEELMDRVSAFTLKGMDKK